jgi:hypothetical protein
MIIKPKKWKKGDGGSAKRPRFRGLVTYMLKGKGAERCTWYEAGNLEGIDRREDAELAINVVEAFQRSNTRVKGDRTYHLIISLHPDDRSLNERELGEVVRRAVEAAGLGEHQYIAVRHSDQEHEHVHVAVNQIHPKTRKIHHPWRDVEAFKALASELEVELGLHRVDRSRGRTETRGRARDYECIQGVQSFARWARHEIGRRAQASEVASWEALHNQLAEAGVRLVRRGNGLALVDARRPELACKASALGRAWSKGILTARLGEFREGPTVEEVIRRATRSYEARPLESTREDGLWKEYLAEVEATRGIRREEQERLAQKIRTERGTQRDHFKLRYHLIEAMPIKGKDKQALYKMLAAERAAAARALKTKIKTWRTAVRVPAARNWNSFLAERAAMGDARAVRRLARRTRGPAVRGNKLHALPKDRPRTSRGAVIHNLAHGVRLRESSGLIELIGDPSPEGLASLVRLAEERFRCSRVQVLGSRSVKEQLERLVRGRGLRILNEREHER